MDRVNYRVVVVALVIDLGDTTLTFVTCRHVHDLNLTRRESDGDLYVILEDFLLINIKKFKSYLRRISGTDAQCAR